MEKKAKLEAIATRAGKTAKSLLENAVRAVDQNDDGKFDATDVSAIAETVGSAVKKGARGVRETAEKTARSLEFKSLRPIFPESLDSADFLMPKFIHVVEWDKKRAESEVCQGAIGYDSDYKGFPVMNIFRDSVEAFGLTLYPDGGCEFYYADPSERDRYIALDEYFSYLKVARVNELQRIAQDLGAKHFRVTYMEERAVFSERKGKAEVKAKAAALGAEQRAEEKKYAKVEIAAEMEFPGHAPMKPQVKYLQRDPSIQTLIAMRMDENSPLQRQKLVLKMSHSSGLKESDAAKIDVVLKGLKCAGNTTVASEAKNEARRYLEYEIDF